MSRGETKAKLNQLTHVSLFTGCGGMDLGVEGGFFVLRRSIEGSISSSSVDQSLDKRGYAFLKKTGFKTIFANDIRPSAKVVYESNFGPSPFYHVESIVNLIKRHHKEGNIFPSEVDLVTGGFPCQDFSVSGKRQGFQSTKNHLGVHSKPSEQSRGKLYMWMREAIDVIRPKVFVAENVKGLVSLGDVKQVIENDFRSVGKKGYIVFPAKVLHAANFGIAQSRERVFFVGLSVEHLSRKALSLFKSDPERFYKTFDPFPIVSHSYGQIFSSNLVSFVKLREILRGLPEPSGSNDPSHINYSKCKFYGKHCQGNREISLDDIGPTIRSEHHGNIEFRRLSEKNGGKYFLELQSGLRERRLTPRECARIQSFPDNFVLVNDKVSVSEAYKLVGNAVPPLLAYRLTNSLLRIWSRLFKEEKISEILGEKVA